jgi:processive 1,2-diacylglycerol beta-glucosyltransferase
MKSSSIDDSGGSASTAERAANASSTRGDSNPPARFERPRVLVVHLSIGGGHSKAATAVANAVKRVQRRAEVALLDLEDVASPLFRAIYKDAYLSLVKSAPRLWGALYSAGLTVRGSGAVPKWLRPRCVGRLAAVVRAFDPHVVLATAAPVSALLGHLIQTGVVRARLAALLTDYHAHPSHLSASVERFLVASTRVAAGLRKLGAPSKAIRVTGIPVDAAFRRTRDPRAARRALGLAPDARVILVMAGALGTGNVSKTIRALDRMRSDAEVVAIAGSNEALEAELRDLRGAGRPHLHPFGYTGMVPQLMAAADLFITKPGGISTTEALCCGLPMVFVDSLQGQEARNQEFFVRSGCAVAVKHKRELASVVDELLGDDTRRATMSERALALALPDAAETVAREVLAMVRPEDANVSAGSRAS